MATRKKISLIAPKKKPSVKKIAKKNPSPKMHGVKGLTHYIVQIRATSKDEWWTDEIFKERDEALKFAGRMHKEAPGMQIRVMMDKGK